jgi:glycosyltransferase involved in cell wall biosynthesis
MLFIPMYNCENQISRVLAKISPELQKFFAEIVVVDNGSKDSSLKVAQASLELLTNTKVTLLENVDNYNLGGSHKVAFNRALEQGFDHVVVLHGDDQGDIKDIESFLQTGEYQKFDQFLGSRFHQKSKLINYPLFKVLGNSVLNFLCSIVLGRWITDMGAGLNIYTSKYLSSRFYLYFPNDLTFNVFMLFYGCFAKSNFKFFPLTWKEEDQVSNAKVFKQGFRILFLLCEYVVSSKKLFALSDNQWSKINYASRIVYSSGSPSNLS